MWPFSKKGDDNRISPAASNDATGNDLGPRGEKLAKKHLKRAGLSILATNYRCPVGEADIIALDSRKQAIVFAEVKTRNNRRHTNPESAVNADKQRRLQKIARYYLSKHDTAELAVRFDVVAVVIPTDSANKPEIRHIIDAF